MQAINKKEQHLKHIKKILTEVKKHIAKNPKHFNMGHWHCDTTACIAGWISLIHDRKKRKKKIEFVSSEKCNLGDVSIRDYATREALEIPDYLAIKLYFTSHWPVHLYKEYIQAESEEETIHVTNKAIDYWFDHVVTPEFNNYLYAKIMEDK